MPPLTAIHDYRSLLCSLVRPLPPTSRVLAEAHGCVLANDVVAQESVPRFRVSAMDGFAVSSKDFVVSSKDVELGQQPVAQQGAVSLRVVGNVPAGTSVNPRLGPSECVSIMTGAPLPDDADAVVPFEQVEVDREAGAIRVDLTGARPRPGQHVRMPGEDFFAGDVVARAGSRVTPGVLSTAAASGVAQLTVRPQPRVLLAATGDELREPGSALHHGQIYESNTAFVAGLLSHADLTIANPLPDRDQLIREHLSQWSRDFDVIVLTGGAGGGAHDVPGQVVTEVAVSGRARVAMQPGKPQAWGVWNGTPVVVLPGNPIAAAVSARLFVVPMVERMTGAGRSTVGQVHGKTDGTYGVDRWGGAPSFHAYLSSDLEGRVGMTQFVPIALRIEHGRVVAEPTHPRGRGSHLVSALTSASAVAVIPQEVDAVISGQLVEVIPLFDNPFVAHSAPIGPPSTATTGGADRADDVDRAGGTNRAVATGRAGDGQAPFYDGSC